MTATSEADGAWTVNAARDSLLPARISLTGRVESFVW